MNCIKNSRLKWSFYNTLAVAKCKCVSIISKYLCTTSLMPWTLITHHLCKLSDRSSVFSVYVLSPITKNLYHLNFLSQIYPRSIAFLPLINQISERSCYMQLYNRAVPKLGSRGGGSRLWFQHSGSRSRRNQLRVFLGYIECLRPSWITWDTVSKRPGHTGPWEAEAGGLP